MSITIAELRSRIAAALTGEIGTKTYQTASGEQTVQALTLDEGGVLTVSGHPWTQGKKPKRHTGLEVVIQPEIDSTIRPLLGGDYYLNHTTNIVLKQWDITDTVKTARSLLIQELGNLIDITGPRIPRNTTLDSVEQQTFTIIQPASS